jgi:hypothetical protein
MANGDFVDLQTQLALMVGADSVAQLPASEQSLIKKCINKAYNDCYVPVDGLRPGWTMQNFAQNIPGRTPMDVTVTQGGSNVQHSDYNAIDPNLDFIGSFIDIGGKVYTRIAKVDDTNFTVLEPIQASSGTHTATVYFNSFRINAAAIDIAGRPELVGDGLLSVMNGKENELTYRSLITGDFYASTGLGNQRTVNFNTTGITYEEGRPLFYFVDPSKFANDIVYRFVLYPLPDVDKLVRFRGHVVPTDLDADADMPKLPGNIIDTILLPMSRYNYCAITRRYTGDNRTFLRDEASEAKAKIRSFAKAQKHTKRRIRVRPGFA